MIDDLNDWAPSIAGNTFFLRGKLSDNGSRKVMSVLELPPSLTTAVQDASSPSVDQEANAKLLATQQYWKSLTTLMDDLRRSRNGITSRRLAKLRCGTTSTPGKSIACRFVMSTRNCSTSARRSPLPSAMPKAS